MPTYSIKAPDGNTYEIEGPAGASDERVRTEVMRQHPNSGKAVAAPKAPAPGAPLQTPDQQPQIPKWADVSPTAGITEAGMQMASGLAALPVAAGASIYELATAPWGKKAAQADEAAKGVQEAMTYQPRTTAGKGVTKAIGTVLGIPGAIGEAAEGAVQQGLEGKGIPKTAMAAEVTARMAPEIAATLLGARYGGRLQAGAMRVAGEAARKLTQTSVDAAKQYVEKNTKLKWDDLPPGIKELITKVARDPQTLKQLKPKTIEREARAERLKMPLTRADAERSSAQHGREERISKTEGNPVTQIRAKQDQALHRRLDAIQRTTGSKTETQEQVGRSVQDSGLRKKAEVSKENYDRLYTKARETEPNATTSPEPFYEMLKEDPDIQHLGWMQKWLKTARAQGPSESPIELGTDIRKAKAKAGKGKDESIEFRPLKLKELDDLRKKALLVGKRGGDSAYYAQQVVKAIDKSFDNVPAGAKAWRAARDAFKAHKKEFEDQGVIKSLTINKKGGLDRRVAVEDTTQNILRRSKEDIGKIRESLHTGGTEKTRAAGAKAWKDLQAGVLDYLREKAGGTHGIQGEGEGRAEFNAAFVKEFRKLDKNGKIDAIFDPKTAARLRDLYEGARDVRTKPSKRISGSDTAANLKAENTLSALEKISKVGKVGPFTAGALKKARGFVESGKQTAEMARAKTTPTAEAAEKVSKAARKKERRHTLRTLRRGGPMLPALTLKEQDQQRQ